MPPQLLDQQTLGGGWFFQHQKDLPSFVIQQIHLIWCTSETLQTVPVECVTKTARKTSLSRQFCVGCLHVFIFKSRPHSFAFFLWVVKHVRIELELFSIWLWHRCFMALLFQAESLRSSLVINFSAALCVGFVSMWTPFGSSFMPREGATYVWFALSTSIRQWRSCFAVCFQSPAQRRLRSEGWFSLPEKT